MKRGFAAALAVVLGIACSSASAPGTATGNENDANASNVNNVNDNGSAACAAPDSTVTEVAGPVSTRPAATTGAWWNGAVVYEIFVRSFQDSDGDGIGDFAGLTARLPYLKDLGVEALWLMPIYPAPSYHGYHVTSYTDVKAEYDPRWAAGASTGKTDFDDFVAAAHQAGIKVLLDLPVNQSSEKHPWFVDAASSATAPHRGWYVWSDTDLGWGPPWGGAAGPGTAGDRWFSQTTDGAAIPGGGWYYAGYGKGKPDLNWDNPDLRQAMYDAALGWVARGVDGFRLDSARYLVESGAGQQADQPGTHTYLRALTAQVRSVLSDALMLGEIWDTTQTISTYFGTAGSQLNGGDEVLPVNFPLAAPSAAVNPVGVATVLDALVAAYPAGAGDAPFLTNHDQGRFASGLGGDAVRIKQAAALLLTLPGTPTLYYGEEIGMLNGACTTDECKRTPMAWDTTANAGFTTGTPWWAPSPGGDVHNVATEVADPSSILARYKQLIALRKASPALRHGDLTRLDTTPLVLAYLRAEASETVLVVHNMGDASVRQAVALPQTGAEPMLTEGCSALERAADGTWWVTLPGHTSGVWRVH